MEEIRIGLAQINPIVGDLEGNTKKIIDNLDKARDEGADICIFPELALTGYPPEDLLLMPKFIEANLSCLKEIIQRTEEISAIVGFVDKREDIYNAAALIHHKVLEGVYHKIFLPNYSVFDENRYFSPGNNPLVFQRKGTLFGITICEDIWYPEGPMRLQSTFGNAEVILNISASPFYAGKGEFRTRMLATRATDHTVIVAFVNQVGGQDELVFDGNSMVLNESGEIVGRAKGFEEDLLLVDLDIKRIFRMRLHDPRRRKSKEGLNEKENPIERVDLKDLYLQGSRHKKPSLSQRIEPISGGPEEIYKALVLGTRDYVKKNGFKKVLIGLSGGIDSALTATIAADSIGEENVLGVAMPSIYSSPESLEDAMILGARLGIKVITIPISKVFSASLEMLAEIFQGYSPDITEENLQARIRGNILMALSNKFGYLVLTTGNKSETSVGYCTLYGDMAGGFAVIRDVPKTVVYELARYRNSQAGENKCPIPERVITKEPSAELRPDQKDTDSLPPYSELDPILKAYVEEDMSLEEIVALGYDEERIKRIIKMVDRSEYKRRQGPPGIKITPRAFGKDRRLPITNKYRNF